MDKDEMQQYIDHSQLEGQNSQNAATSATAQYYLQEQEKGLAEAQLEVDTIKSEIYHLIRQDRLEESKESKGKFDWNEIRNQKDRILSDWGVDRIMQIIHFYINKNTLLSNFSEEQINRLMLKFIRELNDLILLKYQVLFKEPTFEECKEIILERLDDKVKMRMFSLEVLGESPEEIKYKEGEIKKEFLHEMEKNLEQEMDKIKKESRKEKLRDYGLIIAQLEIIVFSTLNRAFRGEERGSLRRHMNVSELIGGKPQVSQERHGGFFGWGRG